MGIGDQKRNGRIVIGFDLPVFWGIDGVLSGVLAYCGMVLV